MGNFKTADPKALGVDPARLDLLLQRVRIDVDRGLLPSAQVALAKDNAVVALETFGDTTPDTRYILQSAGRPVVASIVWKLIGEGALDPAQRVVDIVPEFGTNGKDIVTVEHVLTHTAGFPLAPIGYPKMLDRHERLGAFARWRLVYEPGTRFEYHLTSAGWVIAEIVERLTGLTIAEFLRKEIAEPLGLSLELAVAVERQDDVAKMTPTGVEPDEEFELDPWGPWYFAKPEILAAGEPSHSIVGTARDLVMHYQALFHSGIWTPRAIEEGTRIRVTLPVEGPHGLGGAPANMALFLHVAGDDGVSRAYLPITGSAVTFGGGGAPCQISFMDPEEGLSFAFLTNGYPPSGYDTSRSGRNRIINISNLAADCAF